MKLVQRYLTKNPVYKQAVKITPTQLILHSVGCNQPSAEVFIGLWDKNPPANKVAVHGIIDANTGTIYNLFPWNYRGAHAGGSANYHAIGVEMCESKHIKYKGVSSEFTCSNKDEARACAMRTYKAAVELFAYLCKLYNLNPLGKNVILSHYEGGRAGVCSKHADPEHIWKGLDLDLTMDGFRKEVAAIVNKTEEEEKDVDNNNNNLEVGQEIKLKEGASYINGKKVPQWVLNSTLYVRDINDDEITISVLKEGAITGIVGIEAIDIPVAEVPYVIKVTANALNVRKGPGSNYDVTTVIKKGGYYTIVEVQGNWGKLKSGAGWICLDYTEKV